MRPGLNNKRPRNHRSNLRRGPGHHGNRAFDSNGPDIKIRGSASQILEKYLALARDANSFGDRVMAENYLQHAEHYYRVLNPTNGAGDKQPRQAPKPGAQADGGHDAGKSGNGQDRAEETQS
ncbi:MAG: DUF4167 domain-containing protein [Alphaproteobacteria bacterium]